MVFASPAAPSDLGGITSYTALMSSPASQASPFVAPPEHTPAAVVEALRPELRERFLAEYGAALDEAKTTLDLAKVNEVVEEWWRTAWVQRDPQFWQSARWAERGERGEPVDLDALRR
jgi:uncharacterized protein DUF6247